MKYMWAIPLCIIGGVLMIISSVLGSISFIETILSYIRTEVGKNTAIVLFFVVQILAYITIRGGISVIVGAIIAAKYKIKISKLLIWIGVIMGLIGLLFLFLTGILQGTIHEQINGIILVIIHGSYGFLSVIIIIFTKLKMKEE